MKRMLALVLALLMCSCAMAEGNWYVDEGQTLARRMQALAADDAYFHLYATGNEDLNALCEAFAETDLSKPTGAWFLPLPERETLLAALERLSAMGGAEADMSAIADLSDVGKEELMKRLPASAVSILISESGVSWVVLSSLLSVGRAVEEPEDFIPGYLLLEYPGDYSLLVTFTRPLPGYASVGATLAPAGCLETVKPVLEYAQMLGLPLEMEEVGID